MSQHVNVVVRAYFNAMLRLQEGWELFPEEERALSTLREAGDRIEGFALAPLDDLPLHDAVRIAHVALKLPAAGLPSFSTARPGLQLGKQWLLNDAITFYYRKVLREVEAYERSRTELTAQQEEVYDILRVAYCRVYDCRNADLTDLPLLDVCQVAHDLLGLHPRDIPQFDVSRRYEGETLDDAIDTDLRITMLRDGESKQAITAARNERRHKPQDATTRAGIVMKPR